VRRFTFGTLVGAAIMWLYDAVMTVREYESGRFYE
jgi:hypothetical protein